MEFLIVMMLLLGVMYVMMIRPQRKRQQDHQKMIDGAAVGEDVLTTGGIYGTVTQAEGDDLVVEIADGVEVHMTRRGIAAVLPPEEDADEDESAEAVRRRATDEIEAELDEAAVRAREEAVTSRADGDTAASERR